MKIIKTRDLVYLKTLLIEATNTDEDFVIYTQRIGTAPDSELLAVKVKLLHFDPLEQVCYFEEDERRDRRKDLFYFCEAFHVRRRFRDLTENSDNLINIFIYLVDGFHNACANLPPNEYISTVENFLLYD